MNPCWCTTSSRAKNLSAPHMFVVFLQGAGGLHNEINTFKRGAWPWLWVMSVTRENPNASKHETAHVACRLDNRVRPRDPPGGWDGCENYAFRLLDSGFHACIVWPNRPLFWGGGWRKIIVDCVPGLKSCATAAFSGRAAPPLSKKGAGAGKR